MSTKARPPKPDWHPADIKAALEKRGWSFARIAREYGYSPKSCDAVLRRPFGPVEEIVAEIIGVPATQLWPSRYQGTLRRTGRHKKHRAGQRRAGPTNRRGTAERRTQAA